MGSLISLNRLPVLIAVVFAVVVVAGVAYAQDEPTVPVVETVAVTSDPGDDGGYAIGDVIEIGLTFSEEIRATENLHQITLDVGGDRKVAVYSGAGTRQLPATGTPGITGTAQVGETPTATTSHITDDDGLTHAVFAYQWIRHDPAIATDTNIRGATASTYTMTSEDEGHAIKVRVTFKDDVGNQETLTSYALLTAPPYRRKNLPRTRHPRAGPPSAVPPGSAKPSQRAPFA